MALSTSVGAPLHAAEEAEVAPARLSEADAIACRLDVGTYLAFALSVQGSDGIAAARKWRKVEQPNPSIEEYELPQPITVAGQPTRRIAFGASAIIAVLDLADPDALAAREGVYNQVGDEMAKLGLGAPERGDFRKFLGERVLVDRTEPAAEEGGFGTRETVARTISNVTTHPGKTFYGCSYRMELLDESGKPL